MAWPTQHVSQTAVFRNLPMLRSMVVRGLHNQLRKACLLSFPVSSPLPTMILCLADQWQDSPPVPQASVHCLTHEKLTSGSHAFLPQTHIVPPHSQHACCLGAWLASRQCTSSRSSTTDNLSQCAKQLSSAYAHKCSYMCATVPFLFVAYPDTSNAGAASLSTRAKIRGKPTPSA